MSRQHIGALDGVRGIAVLLVIIFHLNNSMYVEFGLKAPLLFYPFTMGWIGVDLFFILSGFLITGILYDAKGTDKYFTKFYARRSLRIFPLYYIALISYLVLRHNWTELNVYGGSDPIYLWFYVTNLAMAAGKSFGIVDHFWSLAIEEQFYLVWPAFVFRFSRERLMMIAATVWCGATILRVGGAAVWWNHDALFMFTFCRVDTLMTGAFLALLVRGDIPMHMFKRPAQWIAAISFAGILAVTISRGTTSHSDWLIVGIGLMFVCLMFGALLMLSLTWEPAHRLFNVPFLRQCGKYAYGLYIWHAPIVMIGFHTDWARELRGGNGLTEAVVSLAIATVLTLAITMASWHLWEKQFLKLKRHFD